MPTIAVTKRVQVPVDTLRMSLAVRYEEEDIPKDFPCRKGDMWTVEVDIATGKIKDWPGPAFDLYMKVCDEGTYTLLADGQVIAERANEYVPHGIVPGEYGDYVDLEVGADGTIKNWPKPDAIDLSIFDENEE